MDKVSYLSLCLLFCVTINNGFVLEISGNTIYPLQELQVHRVKNFKGRIVGGTNYTIQQVPYQVYLLLQIGVDLYQCGGSIISKRAVLTAAHCLTRVSVIYVRAGSTRRNSGGRVYMTSTFMQHPQYNPVTSDYDFGIVRVLRGIVIDGINTKAITMANDGDKVIEGTNVLVTGWGDTSENGTDSDTLLGVTVPVVSTESCRMVYGQNTITDRMFCAGVPEGGKDSCQGDSGGPAVDDDGIQIGVTSFGRGCARPGVPGVYAKVSSVRAWIKLNTGV